MKDVNLVRKLTWSFHKTTGLDWDDLFQEASLAYLEALRTYDPAKGKITTHLWNVISNNLKIYVAKERRTHPDCVDLTEVLWMSESKAPDIRESLPSKIHPIVDFIMESDSLVGLPPMLARHQVRNFLFQNGWALPEVRKAMKVLKTTFA